MVALAVVTGGTSIAFTAGGFSALGTAATATTAATAATFGATLAAAAGNLGLFLVLGGIAQSISPQPQPSSLDESVQLESFTFSNVVNTSRQGMALPIAYGRLFVGSAVLSSGLDVDQVQV